MTLRLTLRDMEILSELQTARYMTTPQIQALFWRESRGGEAGRLKACQRRLRRLARYKLIRRIEQPVGRGEGRLPYVYTLDKQGAEVLRRELGIDVREIDWRKKNNEHTYPFLQHILATNDLRISIMLACDRHPGLKLESWINEKAFRTSFKDRVTLSDKQGKEHQVAIVPDGFFVLGLGERRANLFVEIDRATVTVRPTGWERRGWLRKIRAYLAYYNSGLYVERYGTRSLRILTITTGAKRLQHLKEATEEAEGKQRFWFTTFDLANDPAMVLTEPIWHVAGKEELSSLL